MPVRSRPLLALALSMLAVAGGLGSLLEHDGEIGAQNFALAAAAPGDEIRVKGVVEPFLTPPESRLPPGILAMLGEYTYILEGAALAEEQLLVLVTDDVPHVDNDAVVVETEVVFRAEHPDRSGRTLIIIEARDWTTPIVFR